MSFTATALQQVKHNGGFELTQLIFGLIFLGALSCVLEGRGGAVLEAGGLTRFPVV